MISILLADDHTIVRKGFRLLLEHEPDFSVLGEAANGREAVEMALKLKPSLVLMDIMMPELNGFQATQRLRLMDDTIRVLILSMYSSQDHVHQVIQSGASGYLLKHCAPKDLVSAVREVARGKTYFTPSVSRQVLDFRRHYKAERGSILTTREFEVLQMVAEGKSNKEIGGSLFISVKTVEKHRQRLMDKLGIHDIAGLTRYAISRGIIDIY
ncbi:MAG TPA: response regulator transcription factor [Bacteroidota bacterium]|nr:response regulator transcription factor [Bacteroidota bacterium]